jgi:S-adenosylmethionine/arginine decarboxylase-like enzyme
MTSDKINQFNHWGLSTLLTIEDCDLDSITSREFLNGFVCDLVDSLDMQRYGEPIIERFGEGDLFGFSVVQLIHTSCVTMHFSEADQRAFIDIFSCKEYDPETVAEYCVGYLMGSNYTMTQLFRD